MIAGLSARDRKTLLVGIASVVAIIAVGKGMPRLRLWQQARIAAAAETRERLLVAESGARVLEETEDSAAVRERRLASLVDRMMVARSPEAAAAALASVLERLSATQGVHVSALMLRPDTLVRSRLARVGVRLSAEGDVKGLLGLLYAAEMHDTIMVVRDLILSQPEPSAPSTRPEALRFEVHVQTLARIAREIDGGAEP